MNAIPFSNKETISFLEDIDFLAKKWNFKILNEFYINNNIDSSIDQDLISSYTSDWSNIPNGFAEILVRPKSAKECSVVLTSCNKCNIPVTISGARTNLTGSATPFGGLILSTENLLSPKIDVDIEKKIATCSAGVILEDLRNKVINESKNYLYYPVDPTSRKDACIGGTISCNASGFVPGIKGSTRYWVEEINLVLINGYSSKIRRGQYRSCAKGKFKLICNKNIHEITIPNYKRPKIKNASGPYSAYDESIDFIDFIVGSEGIFGLITSCKLKLTEKPKELLDLFITFKSEKEALKFHDFLYDFFKNDLSKLNAMEYFGYNCQNYMNNNDYFFKNQNDVGLYIQYPIFDADLEKSIEMWTKIIIKHNPEFDLDNVIILNEKNNFNMFFDSRHSLPDNALSKTKKLGSVSIITDTIVPKNNFKIYLNKIHHRLKKEKIEYILFGHLGDCHLHFHLIPSKTQEQKALMVYDYKVDLCSILGGIYSAEHGTGKRKRVDFEKCYGNKAVQMLREAKKSIDTKYLLNIGNIIEP